MGGRIRYTEEFKLGTHQCSNSLLIHFIYYYILFFWVSL